MMRSLVVSVLVLAVGCSKAPKQAASPAPQGSTPDPYAPAPPAIVSQLAASLAQEAKDRPTGTPTAEQVFAAVEAAGMKLGKQEQVLAKIPQAHYCILTKTTEGLGMAVCEYDDAGKAVAGRAMSEAKFKMIPNRTLAVNGKTLLTVNRTVDTPAANAQRDQALAIFAKLSAK